MELFYSRHPWDKYKCFDYRGVLISEVNLHYKSQLGTFVSVLNTGVSSFKGVFNRGVSHIFNIALLIYNRKGFILKFKKIHLVINCKYISWFVWVQNYAVVDYSVVNTKTSAMIKHLIILTRNCHLHIHTYNILQTQTDDSISMLMVIVVWIISTTK